jgi:hypothetical protein
LRLAEEEKIRPIQQQIQKLQEAWHDESSSKAVPH